MNQPPHAQPFFSPRLAGIAQKAAPRAIHRGIRRRRDRRQRRVKIRQPMAPPPPAPAPPSDKSPTHARSSAAPRGAPAPPASAPEPKRPTSSSRCFVPGSATADKEACQKPAASPARARRESIPRQSCCTALHTVKSRKCPEDWFGCKRRTARAPAPSPQFEKKRRRSALRQEIGSRAGAACGPPPLFPRTGRRAEIPKGRAVTAHARVRPAGGKSTRRASPPAHPAGRPDQPEPRAHP